MVHGPVTAAEMEGAKWISAPCWHNCGSRCVNKVLVKDGKVLRQKTDDTHEDSYDWPQARSCLMGRSLHQQVFGSDRLQYPMKRKHWEPLTGGDKSLRGKDSWERISWDEALDFIAAELKQAKEKYGNDSILYMNMMNIEGYLGGLLSQFGGYVDTCGTQSIGTFAFNPAMYGFKIDYFAKTVNDRYDHENSDYIVLYGFNASWCAFGNPSYYLKHAKAAGCKFVYVGPDYPVTAGFTNAEWIPVRPGTDTAFLLGVAHSMISRDQNGSLIDWDYLNRCTVGFDSDHMPADATTDESFRDYIMGVHDGIEKTPAWASEICGTPLELIDRFADILSCQNNVSIHSNAAPARAKGSENYPQMLMTIAAMGGHFGKPGNACSNDQYYSAFNSGPKLALMGPGGSPWTYSTANNPVTETLPMEAMWDAIVDGKYWYSGHSMTGQFVAAEERNLDIHVIISEQHNLLQSQANINKGIEAFRKVDFVCAQAYTLKTDAKYADIVLPVVTRWENLASAFYGTMADRENVFFHRQVIEPMYEAKSDYEIATLLGEKLGIDFQSLAPNDDKQNWYNQIASAMVMEPTGGYVPLVTITQEDLDRYGVIGTPQQGKIDLEQALDDGVYRVKRSKGDAYYYVNYVDFRKDTEAHPLNSASGKMEIYCQAKSDFFDLINGYSNGGEGALNFVKVSPLPKYLPQVEGYEDSFLDWDKKIRGKYPIQLTHAHYLRRAHTDMDNLPWLREALQNHVYINREDAKARGIANGDVILVHNDNGSFLRPASVVRWVMPGVIVIPHGASVKIDRQTGIDLGGADNILTSSNKTTTPFLNAWNSTLVDYEKYEGRIELVPDYLTEPVIPEMA